VAQVLLLDELKKEAARQLFAYRQQAAQLRRHSRRKEEQQVRRLGLPDPELTAEEWAYLRLWRRIVERTEGYLKQTDPVLYRFMGRYFGLHSPINRRRSKRLRHFEIMEEFHISDSSVYKWRAKVVELTVLEAVRTGKFTIAHNGGQISEEKQI